MDHPRVTQDFARYAASGIRLDVTNAKAYAKAIDRLRTGYFKPIENLFFSTFQSSTRALLKTSPAATIDGMISAVERNVTRFYAVETEYGKTYTEIWPEFAERSYDALIGTKGQGRGYETKADPALVSEWVREALKFVDTEMGDLITDVQKFKHSVVVSTVKRIGEAAIKEGLSINQFVKQLTSVLKTIDRNRARVIARTEVMRAASYATRNGAKTTGLKLKKTWLTADDNQGDRHAQAPEYFGLNNQTRKMNEKYTL